MLAQNDFGLWTNINVKKALNDKWGIECGTEFRTKEHSQTLDQWQIKTTGEYKVNKHLKLNVNYEYHLKEKTKNNEQECLYIHQFTLGLTQQIPISHWLNISFREHYQYIYIMPTDKTPSATTNHIRSRIVAELMPTKAKWIPYTSCEIFNNINNNLQLDEIRCVIGTTYKINKYHILSLGYLLKMEKDTDKYFSKRMHAIQTIYIYNF